MAEDNATVAEFFKTTGRPFICRREVINLGHEHRIFWIEAGLFGTSLTVEDHNQRLIGLFSPNTLLGGVRSAGHIGEPMALMATALADTHGYALPSVTYQKWLSEDPEREKDVLRNCIAKSECQLEGVLVNDLCPVDYRVEVAIAILFKAAGISMKTLPAVLPWQITVTDIAMLVHAERGMVSKAVARLVRDGIVCKFGRRLMLKRISDEIRSWLYGKG
ncbi:hypothetical protein EVA_01667 [gut metagenome]|uniref:Crp/Fnr family transcriptional regulator n=1 Tax=gut metagenome TaxID=749906 RepID=J9DBE5_9ZZZZ